MLSKLFKTLEALALVMLVFGSLAIMHAADSPFISLPEGWKNLADQIPRTFYPVLYAVIAAFLSSKFVRKNVGKHIVIWRLALALWLLVLIGIRFFEFPVMYGFDTRYGAVFLAVFLIGPSLLHISHEIELKGAEVRKISFTSKASTEGLNAPLRTNFFWLCGVAKDKRNMKLRSSIRFQMSLISFIMIFIVGYILWGMATEPDRQPVVVFGAIAITIIICIGATYWIIRQKNRNNWAPNIDADAKLRETYGSIYDAHLDEAIKTRTLPGLLNEDWFVRMYEEQSQFTESQPS